MNTQRHRATWYRQSVVWLAALLYAMSVVGCVVTIIVASRAADPPLAIGDGLRVAGMPLTRAPPPRP